MALISIEEAFRKVTSEIAAWTNKQLAAGLAKKVDTKWGYDLSENNYSKADKSKVDKMPDGLLLTPEKKLYLTQNGSVIDNAVADFSNFSIGGGTGGGGTGSADIKVQSTMDSDEFAVVLDDATDVYVTFNFVPTTTKGYVYVYRGASEQPLDTVSIDRGPVELPVKSYLYKTGKTSLTLKFADSTGTFGVTALTYVITVASLSLTLPDTFSDAKPIYKSAGASFNLQFDLTSSSTNNTVYIILDNSLVRTIPLNTTQYPGNETISLSDKMHGVYSLKIYAELETSPGSYLPSKVYEYKIMYVDGTDPLISSVCQITQAKQYEEFKIPFAAYVANSASPELTLTISQNGQVYSQRTAIAERDKKSEWPIVIDSSLSGDVDFIISYQDSSGNVLASVKHTITILENKLDVEITKHNLIFDLNTTHILNSDRAWKSQVAGQPEVNVKFTNVNWDVADRLFTITDYSGNVIKEEWKSTGTGWKRGQDGRTALRLSGDATAEIEYPLFGTNWNDGATLEMEFAIADVNNRDAEVIKCMRSGIGLSVTADTASIIHQVSAKANYTDGEKIHIVFAVEHIGDYCLITSYLNGVMSSAAVYNYKTSLTQAPAQNITIGSPDCSIEFYSMRFYNTKLTHREIQNNYIASSQKMDLLIANQVYDGNSVDYDTMLAMQKLPIVAIAGELPEQKADTDKDLNPNAHDYYVDVRYTNKLGKAIIDEITTKSSTGERTGGPKIEIQGTSSAGYPRKNWKLKFGTAYQHAEGQIPSKKFCLKADFAEATGTHNTGHANYVHNFYTNKSLPPFELSDTLPYRTTIYGFPCVVFHKETDANDDEKYIFHGKYNFNYDKGSEEAFGFKVEDPRYDKIQSWEFCENKYLACRFLQDPNGIVKDPDKPDDESLWHQVGLNDWKTWFEDRYFYNDDKENKYEEFRRMYDWVYYTNQSQATYSDTDPYTQNKIEGYVDLDGNTHDNDTPEYRLAKFKKEFQQYFNLEFCLIYYLYTFVMLMVDQRAKNQFLTSWDGNIWYPWLYDNDFVNF